MKGNQVIVRSYGDIPLIRLIWDENKDTIFITNDLQFQLLKNGGYGYYIGFPRNDVFRYDIEFAAKIEKLDKNEKIDWSKLVPF